jgi:hypothetical protein
LPNPDPKVVLQVHAQRARATRQALLHGSSPPRTGHSGTGALLASVAAAAVVIIAVLVVVRVVKALHGT